MRIGLCSGYYEETRATGANVRFKETAVALQNLTEVMVITPEINPPAWANQHKTLHGMHRSRILGGLHAAYLKIKYKLDILVSDIVPCIPGKNTYFLVHDLRQFSRFRRHQGTFSSTLYKYNILAQKRIVTVSDFTRSEIMELGSRAKVVVSPNGIGASFVERKISDHDFQYDFIYIATFEDRKDHKTLISALTILKSQNIEFKCLLIGRDLGTRSTVLKQISNAELEDSIDYVESCSSEDLIDYIIRSRVFVSPALYEGFGMPIIEARAIGRPVICSDIKVFREISDDGVHFFPPSDASKLAEKLLESLSFAEFYLPLKNRNDFEWTTIAENILTDFRRNIGNSND